MKNSVLFVAILLSFLGYLMPPLYGMTWCVFCIVFAYASPLIHPFFRNECKSDISAKLKKYLAHRLPLYKKHLVNFICGYLLMILAGYGTRFTLTVVVEQGISIPHGIWLWFNEPVTIIVVLCMFGFNMTNIKKVSKANE